jgi:hypothetical protein
LATTPDDQPSRGNAPAGFGRRSSHRLRAEIFALGGRHRGDALAGARRELEESKLTPERRALLHEVVHVLAPGEARAWTSRPGRPLQPPARLRLLYIAGIFASLAWIGMLMARGHG